MLHRNNNYVIIQNGNNIVELDRDYFNECGSYCIMKYENDIGFVILSLETLKKDYLKNTVFNKNMPDKLFEFISIISKLNLDDAPFHLHLHSGSLNNDYTNSRPN